jgi:aldehyde dehydrogenase (NAD+)
MLSKIQVLSNFYQTNITKSYEFRYKALLNLRNTIKYYEKEIINALKQDLNKPEFETYTSEISVVYTEIKYTLKNLKAWMAKKKVKTPLNLFYSKSYIIKEPLGLILIISPWNYPLQLALVPLIGAIASGNVVMIKPSEFTPCINKVISKIIEKSFMIGHVSLVEGDGSKVVPDLINSNKFEHVFFTGSTVIGKKIANLCSNNLIPYTLELGGKNPTIISKNCDLEVSAKRIVWAKFFNAGQTCIAPDYILVEESIKNKFINLLKHYIDQFYTKIEDFPKIIHQNRFNNLISFLKEVNIIYGGKYNENNLFIEPTLVEIDDINVKLMQEEIFGPILPIISYQQEHEIYDIIAKNPYPLALYIFSKDKIFIQKIINNIKFGGGCINTALFHFVNSNLPFGGIRYSGIGYYHAKHTFDIFSHFKSIVDMSTKIDVSIKYPRYTTLKLKLLKLFGFS